MTFGYIAANHLAQPSSNITYRTTNIIMELNLKDKVTLITGAGSGIGRATAMKFAREGSWVVVADRNRDAGHETLKLLNADDASSMFVECDVSDESNVQNLIRRILDNFGRLDCAVNNAGVIQPPLPTTEHGDDVWNRIMNINLKGVWLCLKHEIDAMLKNGGGSIVNMCSSVSVVGQAGFQLYTASKHGVLGLTRATALEYANSGIRINAVGPSLVDTPMTKEFIQALNDNPAMMERTKALFPIGRFGRPEEIANAVVWLCSNAASFVVGHLLMVDGGFTVQ